MTLSALNRKLLRDLWGMKGQAFAIAMVVAAGVAMYVMYQSLFASLSGTRSVVVLLDTPIPCFASAAASIKICPVPTVTVTVTL